MDTQVTPISAPDTGLSRQESRMGLCNIQPCPQPSMSTHAQPESSLILPHTLDRDKQTRNLINLTSSPDVEIIVSPGQENANVLWNPGFYDQAAKPSLGTITQGFSFTVSFITLNCSEVTPHLDRTLVGESRHVKRGEGKR